MFGWERSKPLGWWLLVRLVNPTKLTEGRGHASEHVKSTGTLIWGFLGSTDAERQAYVSDAKGLVGVQARTWI